MAIRPQTRPGIVEDTPHPVALSGAGNTISWGEIEDLDPQPLVRGRNWIGEPGILGQAQQMDLDGHVRRARDTSIGPLVGADWALEPATTEPIDLEIADFVAYVLFERNPWEMNLRRQLLYYRDGVRLEEVTDDIEPIDTKRFKLHPGSGLGRVVTGFEAIEGWSVEQWHQSKINPRQTAGVTQWIAGSDEERPRYQLIPSDRYMRFTWDQDGADYNGKAIQRGCWGSWYLIQLLKVLEGMAHEKNHIGIPIAQLEARINPEDLKKLKVVLEYMRANQAGWAIFPEGAKFSWSSKEGGFTTDINKTIERLAFDIAHTYGVGWLLLGQKSVGSFNLAEKQQGAHALDVKQHSKFISTVYNCGQDGWSIIRRIVDWNYGRQFGAPRLKAFNLPSDAFMEKVPKIKMMMDTGALSRDEPTEKWLRNGFGMPPADLATRRKDPPKQPGPTPTEENELDADREPAEPDDE